jgi:hypothetical protein
MTCRNRSGPKYRQRRSSSASNAAVSVPERQVRFTEQFFTRLDWLLPDVRGADGTPSVTDFLLLDLPPVRDDLANNFEGTTFETDDPEVRVYIGTGILVSAFAIYAAREGETIEAFWITIDRSLHDQ